MATYQILYWHDIPSQVRAKGEGRERVSVPLSARFQEAIDNAAVYAGLIGSDDYTEAFRWTEPQARDGNPQEIADTVAAELEAQFEQIDWHATVAKIKTN